jgi:chromate transporter
MSTDLPPFPTLSQATRVWARIGLLSFGGPAGQIALMHRILVEERRWIGDARFLHALNFCMLLPGPEAMQLATYVGWLMHGVRGALVAGLLFILPGAMAILALSAVYATWGQVGPIAAVFFGVKAAVLAIVLQAVVRLSRRVLGRPALLAVAGVAFVGLFALDLPFPLIVLGAAALGWAARTAGSTAFAGGGGHGAAGAANLAEGDSLLGVRDGAGGTCVTSGGAFRAGLVALALWLGPVAALLLLTGQGAVHAQIALFFSQLAVLTFGGAYAVLAWVAQDAVTTYGWLAPGQMLDGLGLAETTPGPLILVLQFVGFLAAHGQSGALSPLVGGALGALVASWVTFVPCFAWIFLGAPFMERLRHAPRLASALGAVTAAVVGVVLNLAVWFALHVLFAQVQTWRAGPLALELPVPASLDPAAAGLTALALVAVFWLRWGVGPVLAACAAAGLALGALGAI